jgi:hypothetical protein
MDWDLQRFLRSTPSKVTGIAKVRPSRFFSQPSHDSIYAFMSGAELKETDDLWDVGFSVSTRASSLLMRGILKLQVAVFAALDS